ncbi:hypothetical protein EG870_16025, partial [Enterococcus faecalis]
MDPREHGAGRLDPGDDHVQGVGVRQPGPAPGQARARLGVGGSGGGAAGGGQEHLVAEVGGAQDPQVDGGRAPGPRVQVLDPVQDG